MRQKVISVFILLGLLPILSLAQPKETKNFGSFSLYFENDIFAGTDRCFTGGFKLGWMSKNLKNYRENPRLKWLPFINRPGYKHSISISLAQSIYTPDDIERSDLIREDRPYAGILYFAIGIHSISNQRMDTLEINLGIIGPHSYAEQTQKIIHGFYKGTRPNGWHNQLKDEFALGAIYERKWKLFQSQSKNSFGFDFIPHLGGGLGNVYTYASAGMQIRFGWNLPGDFGSTLIRPGGDCNMNFRRSGRSGFHVFFGVDGKAILRNIFLDGNTFQNSHRVEKKPFTVDALLGIGIRFGHFNISYAYIFWTKKFKTETKGHVFGVFNLSYSY